MHRAASGFTLLEVLVAVLLLSAGLIGAVAMQGHAMRTRHESALLSQALQAASTTADRIRANAAQAPTYLQLNYDAIADGAPAPPAARCIDAACDGWQMAQLELFYLRQLVATLPGGRARICRDAVRWSGGQLRWQCSEDPAAPIVVKIGWRRNRPTGVDGGSDLAPGVAVAVAPSPPAGAAP